MKSSGADPDDTSEEDTMGYDDWKSTDPTEPLAFECPPAEEVDEAICDCGQPLEGGEGGLCVDCAREAKDFAADMSDDSGIDLAAEDDPEACPGCGCTPGAGITPDCDDEGGCGYWKALEKEHDAKIASRLAALTPGLTTLDDYAESFVKGKVSK